MAEISLNNVAKSYGFKNILDGFNLEVNSNDKIAVVGKNGAGKTTLFRIITGRENVDSGIISTRRDCSIGFLEQIAPEFDSEMTVQDVLITSFKAVIDIYDSMTALEEKMANENADLDSLMKKYGNLQELFISKGGYEMEGTLSKICGAFHISEQMRKQKFASLSGGQKTIVCLAKLLVEQPDILLLDEPTNHLDIKTIEWLEEFLKNYRGTVVINSHDRYFLDKVVTKIASLENGKCKVYHGNYSKFVEEQERELMQEFQDYKTQQKQINAMKEAIKRYRDWGNRSSNEKFFKAAANLEKRLERMEQIDRPDMKKSKLPLAFTQNGRAGKDALVLSDITMSFGDHVVLDGFDYSLSYGENICLVGNNGCGKSTLVKIILGEQKPTGGKVELGSNTKIGYLSQHISFRDEDRNILEEFKEDFHGSETEARSILAKFYFNGENVFKRIGSLSGGEKVRLKLAELVQNDVNFLILDEPTNHIDIDTREMLESALEEFKGTILFVSHDRYFINKIAKKIVELKDGKLTTYLGDYDYYNEKREN